MFTAKDDANLGYVVQRDAPYVRAELEKFKAWMAAAATHLNDPDLAVVQEGEIGLRTPLGTFGSTFQFFLDGEALLGRLVFYELPSPPLREKCRPIFAVRLIPSWGVRLGDNAEGPALAVDHRGSWRPNELLRIAYELMVAAAAANHPASTGNPTN